MDVSYEFYTCVKAKQSHYWSGEALRFPGGWDSHISRQSSHGGGKVASPTHRCLYPPVNIPDTHFRSSLSLITSMKNSKDTIGNLTRDLSAQTLIHLYYKGENRHVFSYLLVVCMTSALTGLLCKEGRHFKNTRISQWFTWNNQVFTRWFKYDRDWFVCKQAALRSSCATLREWSHNLYPPSCSG